MRRVGFPFFALFVLVACLAGCSSGPSEDVKLGGIALTEVLDGLLVRVTRTLGSIDGLEAAKAAAPELRTINDDFEDLRYHAPKLDAVGQDELAKRARKLQPELQSMTRAVTESPALADLLGGEMEQILEQLSWLMAPPYRATMDP